jgi:hypothetical protein
MNRLSLSTALWSASALALVALGLSGFFAGTSFTQDDFVWLFLSKFCPTPADIFFRDALCGQFYRPLGQLWYVVVHSIAGASLIPFQAAYLGLHLFNSILVGCLARRLAGNQTGALAGFLFSINGLFISPISNYYCYVFDLLGFCFYLLTLLLLFRTSNSWLTGVASLVTAVAAYFSKESYFTLPGAIALVSGFSAAGESWQWATLQQRQRWLLLHVAAVVAAVAWRGTIIAGFGGYSLVTPANPSQVLAQVADRASIFTGFAGWSLVPHLARWSRESQWTLYASAALLGGVTLISFWRKPSTGWIWPWLWMLCTWAPSMIMTTYAPVSFYACSFGSMLLLAALLSKIHWGRWLGLAIGVYYAIFGLLFYHERQPYIARLRSQEQVLRDLFPDGGWNVPAGARIFLFRSCPDLYPDPIVKYGNPPGRLVSDVMFFNGGNPIDWVITNSSAPRDIWPVAVSRDYQTGYVDMHQYRAYALEYQGHRAEVLRRGPPFRFMQWEPDGTLTDVTDRNPLRQERP